MKTILKKVINWYFTQSSKNYVWMPTGMFPVN